MQLDDVDCQILEALQREGRIRNKDMADRIGLSQSACLDRTRRLERIGVIIGYKAMLNHAALGAPLEVWGEVTLSENSPAALARFAAVGRAARRGRMGGGARSLVPGNLATALGQAGLFRGLTEVV